MKRVLFVCVENSNRSQMAEAFARIHGGTVVEAQSAGSKPSGQINPKAERFMRELGYDLATHRSKSLDEITGEFDAVITMGCGDNCPWVPAKRREDWALLDPKHFDDDGYRAVRDEDFNAGEVIAGVAEVRAASPNGAEPGSRERLSRARKLAAEFLGSALLLATVVGSGVMGVNLGQGNDAVALLANAGATAAMLYVLIVILGPISGAHFNPAVTLVMRLRGDIGRTDAAGYVLVQVAGAVLGVLLAHAMFDLSLLQPGLKVRSGTAQWLSEGVATFGLLLTILLGLRHRAAIPVLVASYIFAAYWFTASTSFANPAVTLARTLTQTFAGIRPIDAPGFIAAQCAGALLALACVSWLLREPREAATQSEPTR